MPPRFPLTSEQRLAACSPERRLLVVASPGCGKTTVASERFGFHRYSATVDPRRCLALSFTRAATAEYERRIRARWGPSALSWPHRAMTLDSLHVELVEWLLRSGAVRWSSGHVGLSVEDSWRGQKGVRRLADGQYVAKPALRAGTIEVVSSKHRGIPITRIGRVADLREHFDAGRCTHLEVREVLGLALRKPDLRAAIGGEMQRTTRAIVVDEVFDGNDVDLAVVRLAADVGLAVALIGDPWQAVYEFRGANPAAADRQIGEADFERVNVETSFRFRTDRMKGRAADLRSRRASVLTQEPAERCDVVLASEWDTLWRCENVVLPLSFGTVRNQTDAALLVLLNHITERRLGRQAVYLADAHAFLRFDGAVATADLHDAAAEAVTELSGPDWPSRETLDRWRAQIRRIGAPVQLRRLDAAQESAQVKRLRVLAGRLATTRSIPGMTVHQAKGGEWPNVGLRLSTEERGHLAAGLNPRLEVDRVVYVAATRAKDNVWLVPSSIDDTPE